MNAETKVKAKVETVENVIDEMDKRAADNLRIWNTVCTTDPAHTKRVNQRGGFTAISAHYQVMSATRAFGPIGIGWGYVNGEPIFHDTLVVVPVTLWHGRRENTFGPVYGSAEVRNAKGYIDADAPKKAATDGLTKGLSHLGFNADVFLGMFDDNKYVEAVTEQFHPKPDVGTGETPPAKRVPLDGPYTSATALKTAAREFVRTLESLGDLDEFIAWSETADYREFCVQLAKDMPDWWAGGPSVPAEFVPLEIRIRQKRMDLEQLETVKG